MSCARPSHRLCVPSASRLVQARRLETQLYQRAQDLRTIEMTQRQAAHARAQVRQLEQHHLEQAARISQGAKSLQRLQDLIRESILSNNAALGLAEAHERELADLREELRRDSPEAAAKVARLRSDEMPCLEQLRHRAFSLENALAETERSAMLQIGVTPPTSVAMSTPPHAPRAVATRGSAICSRQLGHSPLLPRKMRPVLS